MESRNFIKSPRKPKQEQTHPLEPVTPPWHQKCSNRILTSERVDGTQEVRIDANRLAQGIRNVKVIEGVEKIMAK